MDGTIQRGQILYYVWCYRHCILVYMVSPNLSHTIIRIEHVPSAGEYNSIVENILSNVQILNETLFDVILDR